MQLAAATKEAEKLLKEISENTAVAEKEKNKVAVIVDGVTKQAAVCCWPPDSSQGSEVIEVHVPGCTTHRRVQAWLDLKWH